MVVDEQLFKAGSGDVGEFEFGFFGTDGRFGAFDDVLLAGSGGLDHLVVGAVEFLQERAAEAEGEVVDDFGFFVGEESFVVAVFWEEVGHGKTLGEKGRRGKK